MLGAWLLAWGWAAEAHEPSYADGAPGSQATPSVVAAPAATPEEAVTISQVELADAGIATAPLAFAKGEFAVPPAGQTYEARRRPRRIYREPTVVRREWDREPDGWLTLRAGFFDTEEVPDNDFLFGAKFTGAVAPSVRIGVAADVMHREEDIEGTIDVDGEPTRVTLGEVSSNLIPLMGVIEFHLPTETVRPYFGFGAGYEWLLIDEDDFESDESFEADFSGFGWQLYGGLNFRAARNVEIGAEAFMNNAEVERTVFDVDLDARVKEEIDVDGVGFRAGVSFGF